MKVLEFIRKFNDSTHTFIYNEMKGLQEEGHELTVACVERVYEKEYPFEPLEVLPFSIPQRIWNNLFVRLGLRMYYRNGPLRRGIRRLARRFQPEVIHCHFGPDALYFLDNYEGSGIPVFISFHGFDASIMLRNALYCRRLDKAFQRPDVFPVFVSEFMAANVARHARVPRHFILYYGTDTDFFRRRRPMPPRAPFTFLQVSSFREKKGHEYTVEAFARLLDRQREANIRLVLAGDGARRAEIEALCRQLGLQDRVEFPGFVTPDAARQWMEQAHAFVHHSVTGKKDGDMEGIPNALMEAMAMELPVLSTLHSGIPELVEHGVNGYLVEERDVEAYSHFMEKIMDWPQQPENREKVLARFEKRQHARQLSEYYEKAVEEMGG